MAADLKVSFWPEGSLHDMGADTFMKRCMVCGASPTVKAHLFPRALIHDIRDEAPHVIAVQKSRTNLRTYQSGQWDDRIVCALHEEAFAQSDRYAVNFCRTFADQARQVIGRDILTAPNGRPDLLITFAHAVVWRHAASLVARGHQHWLGSYFERIGDILFEGDAPLRLAVLEPGNMLRGQKAFIGVHPFPARMEGVRLTRFEIGGLAFFLKTDQRPWPEPFHLFDGDQDPLLVLQMDKQDIGRNSAIRDITAAALGRSSP